MNVCNGVKDNCWNLYESYGVICVGCGCCSNNEKEMIQSRINVLRRQLDNCEHYKKWDCQNPQVLEVQRKNVKLSAEAFRKQIKKYEDMMEEVNMYYDMMTMGTIAFPAGETLKAVENGVTMKEIGYILTTTCMFVDRNEGRAKMPYQEYIAEFEKDGWLSEHDSEHVKNLLVAVYMSIKGSW